MNVDMGEDSIHIINRFKWIANDKFIIVNKDGLEKIVNINHGYQEESFNQRPLFNEISGKEWEEWPYYVKRENLYKHTLARLKRMYQTYKTDYFLFNERDPSRFYKGLLTID